MFSIIVFRLGSDKLVAASSTVSHKGSVTGCDSSLEGGRVDDFSFSIIKVHFVFC